MATQTYEQLIAGANKIKENELPESNTHDIVGEQLLQMTNKMQEESKKITELNISNLYPTNGEGGTNRYTLAGAIARVPQEYRLTGIKVTFVNEGNDTESWEYKGKEWVVGNFSEVGARKFSELNNKIDNIDITSIEGAETLESLIIEDKPETGVGEEGYLSRVEIPVKRNNGYIGKVGQISTSSLAYYSDFIPVKKNEEYEAIAYVTGSVSSITSYSEESDDAVVDVNVPNVSNNTSTIRYKIPDGVICMRYSTYTADKGNNKNGLYAINSIYATGTIEKVSPSYTQGTIDINGAVASDSNSLYADISVTPKDVYLIKAKFKSSNYIAFFNSSNELIALSKCVYSDSTVQEDLYIQAPANSSRMKFSVGSEGTTEVTRIETKKDVEEPVTTDGVITRLLRNHDERIKKLGDGGGSTSIQSEDKSYRSCLQELGFVPRPNIDADYCFIPFYGQSFTVSGDAGKVTDYEFDENVFMLGNSPLGVGTTDINHMSATNDYIICSFADTLSRLLKMYSKKQDILAQSFGIGGKKIQQLSKGDSGGLYESNFMAGLANAKAAVENQQKTMVCPFIVYLQGESDLNDTTKDDYKRMFEQLVNDMQDDVVATTGQKIKPIIITYTPGNVVFKSKFNEIQQAILDISNERDDVYCVGPYYYMPTVAVGHLTPDGRRWLAEMIAKYVFLLTVRGLDNTISIDTCKKVGGNSVLITFNVPNPPLIINNIFKQIQYEEQPKYYGLNAYSDFSSGKNEVAISSIQIIGNSVKLTFEDGADLDNLVITYANWNSYGVGYISDSANWVSYNKYIKEQGTNTVATNDKGESLVGKKYPMQSWLPQFCITVKDYL